MATATPTTTTAEKPVLAGASIPITPVTSSLTAPGAAGDDREGDEEGVEIGEEGEEEENEVEEIGEDENLEFFTSPITAPTTTTAN